MAIDWANDQVQMNTVQLEHWFNKIQLLTGEFTEISFKHIYRKLNDLTDSFSKLAIDPIDSLILFY